MVGLENATFKWNEVAEHVDKDSDNGKSKVDLLRNQVRWTKLVRLSGAVSLRVILRETESVRIKRFLGHIPIWRVDGGHWTHNIC